MNKILMLFAAILIFSNCSKIDEFTQFNLGYKSQITVSPTAGLNLPLNLFTPEMETNSESEFSVNDTNKDLIEEILLEKLDMKITAPSDQTFDFLKSVAVYMEADGLAEIKIAEATDIPENIGAELSLTPAGNDLAEYIKKDAFNLRVNVITDKTINREVQIEVDSEFFVDAKLLGI